MLVNGRHKGSRQRAPLRAKRRHELVLAEMVQHRDLDQVVVEIKVGHNLVPVLGAFVNGRAVVRGRRLLLLFIEAQVYLHGA